VCGCLCIIVGRFREMGVSCCFASAEILAQMRNRFAKGELGSVRQSAFAVVWTHPRCRRCEILLRRCGHWSGWLERKC